MSPPGPGPQTAKRPAPMRDGPLRHRRRLTCGVSAARSVQRIATGLLGALGGADGQLDALTDGGVDVLPVLQRLGQHRLLDRAQRTGDGLDQAIATVSGSRPSPNTSRTRMPGWMKSLSSEWR